MNSSAFIKPFKLEKGSSCHRYSRFKSWFTVLVMVVLALLPIINGFSISGTLGSQQQLIQSQTQPTHFTAAMFPGRIEWNPLYTYTSSEAQLFTAIYEGLVIYHPRTLQPIPGVASSWTRSDDGRTYTFTIRPNARYHDGTPVRAQDFRDTWIHMLQPSHNAPFGFLLDKIVGVRDFRTGRTTSPSGIGIQVPNDQTLVLNLINPAPHFLSILAHQSLVPMHRDFRNTRRWGINDQIPSNGPFIVSSLSSNRIEFARNPHYWDRTNVGLDRITIIQRDDAGQNTRDFNSGSIDWIMSSFDSSAIRVPNSLLIGAQFATTYLFPNTQSPIFANDSIRRAILSYLPMDSIRNPDIYFVPSARLVPQIDGYPEPQGFQNLSAEEALSILEDQGFASGRGLRPLRIILTQGQESQRIGQLIKSALESALELSVVVSYHSFDELQEIQATGDFDLSLISWVGDYADPLTFLDLWQKDNPINLARFNDPAFEELLDEAALKVGNDRFAALSRAESRLITTGAVIPIAHSPSINVIDLREISGWYVNPLDIHPFKDIRFEGNRAPADVVEDSLRFWDPSFVGVRY
jgi:oligopeptide transport system substrate-binding protein